MGLDTLPVGCFHVSSLFLHFANVFKPNVVTQQRGLCQQVVNADVYNLRPPTGESLTLGLPSFCIPPPPPPPHPPPPAGPVVRYRGPRGDLTSAASPPPWGNPLSGQEPRPPGASAAAGCCVSSPDSRSTQTFLPRFQNICLLFLGGVVVVVRGQKLMSDYVVVGESTEVRNKD